MRMAEIRRVGFQCTNALCTFDFYRDITDAILLAAADQYVSMGRRYLLKVDLLEFGQKAHCGSDTMALADGA